MRLVYFAEALCCILPDLAPIQALPTNTVESLPETSELLAPRPPSTAPSLWRPPRRDDRSGPTSLQQQQQQQYMLRQTTLLEFRAVGDG
jgi:hypothetical protein